MSWSENIYSFLATTQVSPGFFFAFDALLNYSDPGVIFEGTETNAVYTVIREIAGDLWVAQNADWNGTNWIPKNLSVPVTFTVLRSPANVTFPGYEQKYQIASGITPATPGTSNLIFQITNTGVVTNSGNQRGTATGMAADGTLNTLTYASWGGAAFPNATDQIFLTIIDPVGATGYFVPVIVSKTASGVTFQIFGGASGATVLVDFNAFGH